MKRNLSKDYLLLAVIVLLAFFLRFYKVADIPPALNWDEISISYNAYSILKTGHDEWGQLFPVHFKSYGEYKLPVQIYGSIPGIAIFGLNELGVRITPVVYGTLTVLLMFFLGRALFKSSSIGLISALFLAISPWHIQLTRASFESSFAVFWIVMGVWFLIKGFTKKRWLIFSMIPFAISVFTYNSARIFTPLFLLALLLIYRKTFVKFKKTILISAVVFGILLLPLTPYLFSGDRSARYKLVSVTDDPGLIPRINENRGKANLPDPLPRLIHNKITYVSFYIVRNYLAHFSPDFLFINGAPHKQHHVQGIGQLYLYQAPFLLFGLYLLFKNKHQFKGLLLAWLLITFIPVSVTNDSIPHALRTLIAAPVYQFLTAYGMVELFFKLQKKNRILNWSWVIVLVIVGAFSFKYYLHLYYDLYSQRYSRDWQFGYKQVINYIKQNQDKYDQIVFSRHYGEPHMFTLFYLAYDPTKYQHNPNLVRFETFDWVRVLNFDKFYFPDLGDKETSFAQLSQNRQNKKTLYIGLEKDFPADIPRLEKIKFLNGDPAFDIVELK